MEKNSRDEDAEAMVEELLQKIEQNRSGFTQWEREFLESIEEQMESRHLTDRQWETLEGIYGKRA